MSETTTSQQREWDVQFEYEDEDGWLDNGFFSVTAASESEAEEIALDEIEQKWFLEEDELFHFHVELANGGDGDE